MAQTNIPLQNNTGDVQWSRLLNIILDSTKYQSIKETADFLEDNLANKKNALLNAIMQEVIKNVCSFFKVSEQDVRHSNKRGDVVTAKKMCFLLLMAHAEISEYKISKYFKRNRAVVNRAKKEFEEMKSTVEHGTSVPDEKKFVNAFEYLNQCILEKKKQLEKKFSKK